MTVIERFRASKFKRLVAALVAAFDFHSGGLSRRHLGIRWCWISARFYFKLRVDALFSCSQALNRADFEAEQQNPRELRAANFECIPELQINRKLRVDALKAAPRL